MTLTSFFARRSDEQLALESHAPNNGVVVGENPRSFSHDPVMVEEVVALMEAVPAGLFIDATVGGGGHAEALLRSRPDCCLIGIDRDPDAREAARRRLVPYRSRAQIVASAFGDLESAINESAFSGAPGVSGVLFDLGVSSWQLDAPERGFSLRANGPLDMRMDPSLGRSAADIVNTTSSETLTRLFVENGEGRLSARIADFIVKARPISDTATLASVVESAVPAALRRRGHPATRVFQALRIAVNDELSQLRMGLEQAISLLLPGGVVAVISYHSGEDRIVKEIFVEKERGGCTCPPQLPCVCGAVPQHERVRRGSVRPTTQEIAQNPRASAARLRALRALAVNNG